MQEMLTELLIAQPEDPIPFMISFLEVRRKPVTMKKPDNTQTEEQ